MKKLINTIVFLLALSFFGVLASFFIGVICAIWDVQFIVNIYKLFATCLCLTLFFGISFFILDI